MLTRARIPLGYLIGGIWRDVVGVGVMSFGVAVLVARYESYMPALPMAVPAILGTAISIILSFMINQSYDRWWEARKVWGAIVNDSRTLARQVLAFVGPRADASRMVRRQIAWCYALGQSLRGLDWGEGARPHLDAAEAERVTGHRNRPLALASEHAGDVSRLAAAGEITDYQRVALDDSLTRLVDSMGRAERIKSTVFPRTYRASLHGAIYLFIILFSVAMAELDGWWELPVAIAVAVPFFLLERTAGHLQDPFENRPADTPMTAIARTIEINLLQLLGETEVPEPLAPQGFYLL